MKIAIAVDGSERDSAVLAWSARFARPGDDLHVVHAYRELSLAGSVWLPAVRAGDRRRHDARRVVNVAQSVLHAALGNDRRLAVGGSTVTGAPHQVLSDLSAVADLLVVGSHPRPGAVCEIDAACPVAVVPGGWAGSRSHDVGVLTGPLLSTEAMDRASSYAQRGGRTVLVVRTATEAAPADLESLDLQVASWSRPDGPPIVTEVRHDDPADGVRALRRVLDLIVVDAGDEAMRSAVRVALDELGIPVVLVGQDCGRGDHRGASPELAGVR